MDFEELRKNLQWPGDPSCLRTVSMTELFENVYQRNAPIIDGLLYMGMYLFVGAPKLVLASGRKSHFELNKNRQSGINKNDQTAQIV